MTNTRELPFLKLKFAKESKFSTEMENKSGNRYKNITTTNLSPDKTIHYFTIVSDIGFTNSPDIVITTSIAFANAEKRNQFQEQFSTFLTSKNLQGNDFFPIIFSATAETLQGLVYQLPINTNQFTEKLNALFTFIDQFEPLDIKTIETIYKFFEFQPSSLVEALKLAEQYVIGATMGLFSKQENNPDFNNFYILAPEIAGLIAKYLADDIHSILLTRKDAVIKAKEKIGFYSQTNTITGKKRERDSAENVVEESKKLKS